MARKHITLMIISTVPDMFAEHYFFIKNVFPDLKEICLNHDIELEYLDLFYSMTEEEFNTCRSIRKYFTSIDSDRTFYICFRGQKLGCIPTHEDVDKATIQKYPELVDYIGDMSFTELTVMHAIHPFEKIEMINILMNYLILKGRFILASQTVMTNLFRTLSLQWLKIWSFTIKESLMSLKIIWQISMSGNIKEYGMII